MEIFRCSSKFTVRRLLCLSTASSSPWRKELKITLTTPHKAAILLKVLKVKSQDSSTSATFRAVFIRRKATVRPLGSIVCVVTQLKSNASVGAYR